MNTPHRLDHSTKMLADLMERIKTRKTPKYQVYLILINGTAAYIGHTGSTLNARLCSHLNYPRVHKSFWGDYVAEHKAKGSTFTILPLAYAHTKAEAKQIEDKYISRYLADGADLFNRISNGRYSLDARRRQSASKKGLPRIAFRQIYDETTNTMYPSIHEAARELDLLASSISNSIRLGCRLHGHKFRAIQ